MAEEQKGILDVAAPSKSGYLTHVASPADIEKAHSEEVERILEADKPDVIDPLVGFFQAIINENTTHRQTIGVEDQLLDCEYRVQSKYTPTKIQQIRDYGGSEIYMGLTGVKTRAADAWMQEILTTDREQIWRIEPTPIVDIPKNLANQIADKAVARIRQLQEESAQRGVDLELTPAMIYDLSASVRDETLAERRALADEASARMEKLIQDQMVEMNFPAVFNDAIGDVTKSKVAILKGPIACEVKARTWDVDEKGIPTPTITKKIIPKIFRVDPKDFFPSPICTDEVIGNTVERMNFERSELAAFRGQPGWSDAALDRVLENFNNVQRAEEYTTETDDLRNIEPTNEVVMKTVTTGWEVWADTQGQKLLDYGFKFGRDGKTSIDPNESYDINAILIDSEIVYMGFNPCEMCSRPYSASGWNPITGSFWYESIPELMTDLQDMCNGSARALANNMAFCSGPQTVINDIKRVPDGEELTPPSPLKLWQFINEAKSTGKPIEFFMPDSNAAELLGVYDRFAKLADDYTGIPAYAYGNDKVAGAGRTASGLSMLMSSAARGIKAVILRMDEKILNKIIKDLYYYNLKYMDDPTLAYGADINVRATGAIQVMIKETMAQRRLEFLQATTNDLDFKVIGAENRANLLREIASTLDLDSNPVQTRDQISEMIQRDAQAAAEAREVELAELSREAAKDEAEMALKAAETALAYAKANTEANQNQQKLDQEAQGGEGG
jgi:hypothetical protein